MNEVARAIGQHVRRSFSALDPNSFEQEPAYVSALMARLIGTAWENDEGAYVKFNTMVVNDRGRNSAESKYGADFAITLDLNGPEVTSSKAILGQGKKGIYDDLSSREKARLDDQCSKMAQYTNHYVILETPKTLGVGPTIRIGRGAKNIKFEQRQNLTDYIIDSFVGCNHGDRRHAFVSAVQHSNLRCLEIIVEGLDPDLTPIVNRGPTPDMF